VVRSSTGRGEDKGEEGRNPSLTPSLHLDEGREEKAPQKKRSKKEKKDETNTSSSGHPRRSVAGEGKSMNRTRKNGMGGGGGNSFLSSLQKKGFAPSREGGEEREKSS